MSVPLCFTDVFVDWKQNVNEVTVRLRCGDGVLRIEDINTTFTDTHCHVRFPGRSSRTDCVCVCFLQFYNLHSPLITS